MKKSNPKVESLGMTVRFDRMFDIAKYYPVPGAYSAIIGSGEEIFFDFKQTSVYRLDTDSVRLVAFELDTDYSEIPSKGLTKKIIESIKRFTEIFIYTGENNGNRPNVTEISDMQFFFSDGIFNDIWILRVLHDILYTLHIGTHLL